MPSKKSCFELCVFKPVLVQSHSTTGTKQSQGDRSVKSPVPHWIQTWSWKTTRSSFVWFSPWCVCELLSANGALVVVVWSTHQSPQEWIKKIFKADYGFSCHGNAVSLTCSDISNCLYTDMYIQSMLLVDMASDRSPYWHGQSEALLETESWTHPFILIRLEYKFRNKLMNSSALLYRSSHKDDSALNEFVPDFTMLFYGTMEICLHACSPRCPESRTPCSVPSLIPRELSIAVKIWS